MTTTTELLRKHRPVVRTPAYANGRVSGCECGFEGDVEEYGEHLAELLDAEPEPLELRCGADAMAYFRGKAAHPVVATPAIPWLEPLMPNMTPVVLDDGLPADEARLYQGDTLVAVGRVP